MLSPQTGWTICLLCVTLLGFLTWKRHGLSLAMGMIVATSFAMPVWAVMPIGGLPIRIQTAAAIVALLFLVIVDFRRIWSPLVLLDFVIASMFTLHVASDIYHGGIPAKVGLVAYGEWVLPYVAGRFAISQSDKLDLLARWICGLSALIGICGIFESFTQINPWEVIFGLRPLEETPRNQVRLGFRRAYGPTLHPLFFGMLLLCLAPWCIAAMSWARSKKEGVLAAASFCLTFLGSLFTISRGPVLGYLVSGFVFASFRSRIVAVTVGLSFLFLVGWMVMDMDGVVKVAESLVGEKRKETKMQLDGEKIELSTAKFRLTQIQVMFPAFREAGFLGYGSRATSTLPPDVPYLPKDEKTRMALKWVDNAYLMYGLRFGWTGTGLFFVLLLAATWTGGSMLQDRWVGVLGTSLGSMFAGFAVILWTVWLSYDCGFAFLWSAGILGGLAVQRRRSS